MCGATDFIANRLDITEAWFDDSGDAPRLIAATRSLGIESEFWAEIAPGAFVLFRHLADLKGQRLFEATSQRWEGGQSQSSPSPLLQLSGPFRRDHQGPF